jgi:hypothetical protein
MAWYEIPSSAAVEFLLGILSEVSASLRLTSDRKRWLKRLSTCGCMESYCHKVNEAERAQVSCTMRGLVVTVLPK